MSANSPILVLDDLQKGIKPRQCIIVLRHFVVRRGRIPAAASGRLPCNQPPSRALGAVHGDYRRNFTAPSLVHQIIGLLLNGLEDEPVNDFMSFPKNISRVAFFEVIVCELASVRNELSQVASRKLVRMWALDRCVIRVQLSPWRQSRW